MLKKVLVGVGVLLVGSWLWVKTDMSSYVCTAFHGCKSIVKSQVPIDFEIKRAKDMLANNDKVDDKLISAMAREMVAIKHLEKEINDTQAAYESARQDIAVRNEELKTYQVGKTGLASKETFAKDLELRFKRFKTVEVSLKTKKDLLVQHQERLNAAKEQRDGLKGQKLDLAARIENLETQVAVLKAAESRSKVVFDNGQLGELNRIKDLVDSLEKRIDTDMTELQIRDEIRATQPAGPAAPVTSPTSLSAEIDSHLNGKAEDAFAGK